MGLVVTNIWISQILSALRFAKALCRSRGPRRALLLKGWFLILSSNGFHVFKSSRLNKCRPKLSEVGVLPYWGRYKTKLKVFRVSGVWSEPDLRIFWVLSIRLSLPSVFMRKTELIKRTRTILLVFFWVPKPSYPIICNSSEPKIKQCNRSNHTKKSVGIASVFYVLEGRL